MSQQELSIDSIKAASGNRGSSSRTCTSSEPLSEQQTRRHIPLFEPIDAADARARATVEQWRIFTMLLEAQVGASLLRCLVQGFWVGLSSSNHLAVTVPVVRELRATYSYSLTKKEKNQESSQLCQCLKL